MKIAFCADSPIFKANRILQIKLTKEFPGAAWTSIFAKLAKRKNFEVVTGDKALANLETGHWNPHDILIIQLLDAPDGNKLAKLGAKQFMLIGLEVPLYAYDFYRKIKKNAPAFHHRLLYSGILKLLKADSHFNYPCHFPSFNTEDILPINKWSDRKFLVMVAANKYFEKVFPFLLPHYLTEHLDWTRDQFIKLRSPLRKYAIKNELINKRLEAIEYFGKQKNLFSLFGANWHDLSNLPRKWHKRLKKPIRHLNPKICKDKIETISHYQFAICFENTSYPGCITEKIIDCFVAGVIPIYLGAPDITKFVPAGSFINMRSFNSFGNLHKYLMGLNHQDALKIISNGRKFLHSPEGKLFSHEGLAKFILNLAVENTKNKLQFYPQFNEDSLLCKIIKGKKKGQSS